MSVTMRENISTKFEVSGHMGDGQQTDGQLRFIIRPIEEEPYETI